MVLSEDELFALTRRKRSRAQARVLRGLGLIYRVRPDGSLAVARAHIQDVFCIAEDNDISNEIEPNWGAV